MQRAAAAGHRATQTRVRILLSITHFLLLLQPRGEYLSMTLEAKRNNPQLKKHPGKEPAERLRCLHGKVGKLRHWFSLYQVWPNILGAQCTRLRAWVHDLLSIPPPPPGTDLVHLKQLVQPQVVSKLTLPWPVLFFQEIPVKVWFNMSPSPLPPPKNY